MRKLNRTQMRIACWDWEKGASIKQLAREFRVHPQTMAKYLRQYAKGVVQEWQ